MPYVDWGACPFEGCVYREWIAQQAAIVRTARRKDAPVTFHLSPGDKVVALTGVVVVTEPGIVEFPREATLTNMRDGGMISEHDYRVGKAIATGLCGGDVETGTLVNEDWLLTVERKMFIELGKTEKTQARIKNMLETGKPLRN